MRRAQLSALLMLAPLAGCGTVVLAPSGDIAAQQRDLLVTSTLLMLLIVVPVMVLTVFFAWRYSEKRRSRYDPDWHHSTGLELDHLDGAARDHHLHRRHHLDRHPPPRPLPPARAARRAPAGAGEYPAPRGAGRRPRLEMALHLSQAGHRHGQRRGRPDRPAGPLPPHLAVGDERLLRPGARRDDLRHARHGIAAPRGDERPRQLRGLLVQLQRRRLLRHALPAARPRAGGLRCLARQGAHQRRAGARPGALSRAGAAQRERGADQLRRRRPRAFPPHPQPLRRGRPALHRPDGGARLARRHRLRRHAQHHAGRGPGGERPRPRALLRHRVLHPGGVGRAVRRGHPRPPRPAAGGTADETL